MQAKGITETDSKAPGKILFVGGYSVLERPNPGYVITADCFVHAKIRPRDDNQIEINAPQLESYAKGKVDVDMGKVDINVPEPLKLVATAIRLVVMYAKATGREISGFTITTQSDPEFAYRISNSNCGTVLTKSGLGSSAAVTVATVGGVLTALGINVNENDCLHKLSQLAHAIATEKVGSGFDIAAATYGDIIYSRYSPELIKTFPKDYSKEDVLEAVRKQWDYSIEPLKFPHSLELMFANFVGEAAVTVSLVKEINKFKEKDPETYSTLMKKINSANVSAIAALRKISAGNYAEPDLNALRTALVEGRILTKELGIKSGICIEPDDITDLIKESEKRGAFVAKLPGAGGKDAIMAICTNGTDKARLHKFWSAQPTLSVLKIRPNNSGFSSVSKPARVRV